MTFRTPAIATVLTLLGFAATHPVSAQPIVPSSRPTSNSFQSFFYPGSQVVPNANMMGAYGLNRLGNQQFGANNAFGPGVGGGQGGAYGPWTPYFLSRQPVVFNYRSHWYANYYSHWYPNGRLSGTGVLSNGGIGGSGFRVGGVGMPGGLSGGFPGGAGFGGGLGNPGGMMGGGGAMPVIRP